MRLLISVVLAFLAVSCAGGRPKGPPTYVRNMVVTGYCRCGACTGWRRNWRLAPVYSSGPNRGDRKRVGITSSGAKAKPGHTIAADITRYPYGTVMYVPGYGFGRVEDTGSAIKGDSIDLFFRSHRGALAWGRETKAVKIWLPGDVARRR